MVKCGCGWSDRLTNLFSDELFLKTQAPVAEGEEDESEDSCKDDADQNDSDEFESEADSDDSEGVSESEGASIDTESEGASHDDCTVGQGADTSGDTEGQGQVQLVAPKPKKRKIIMPLWPT